MLPIGPQRLSQPASRIPGGDGAFVAQVADKTFCVACDCDHGCFLSFVMDWPPHASGFQRVSVLGSVPGAAHASPTAHGTGIDDDDRRLHVPQLMTMAYFTPTSLKLVLIAVSLAVIVSLNVTSAADMATAIIPTRIAYSRAETALVVAQVADKTFCVACDCGHVCFLSPVRGYCQRIRFRAKFSF